MKVDLVLLEKAKIGRNELSRYLRKYLREKYSHVEWSVLAAKKSMSGKYFIDEDEKTINVRADNSRKLISGYTEIGRAEKELKELNDLVEFDIRFYI